MSDDMGLNTKAGMELFARVQMHNLSHHPTWDQNMAYLKAIQRVEREAAAATPSPDPDALADALSAAMQDHILDKSPGKGWPHPRSGATSGAGHPVMRDGCDDLCADDIAERLAARLDEGSATSPRIREVVGQGDGTMIVTLDDGTERRITEQEYLDWPRDEGSATPEPKPHDDECGKPNQDEPGCPCYCHYVETATPEQDHPRAHLLGWGEDGPPIGGRTEPCAICHAPNGRPHLVIMMGLSETVARLSEPIP